MIRPALLHLINNVLRSGDVKVFNEEVFTVNVTFEVRRLVTQIWWCLIIVPVYTLVKNVSSKVRVNLLLLSLDMFAAQVLYCCSGWSDII